METRFTELKKVVCRENLRLPASGLVILTEGNVSQITEDRRYVCIKPSGFAYAQMVPDSMVVVDMDGAVVDGKLWPSVDLPTHLEIYRHFKDVGGIVHTHSPYATMFAQLCAPISCYGATHADDFFGDVPVTRLMTEEEITSDYELNTGRVICEVLDPLHASAVLVAHHGPFVTGVSAQTAVNRACVLEKIAMMAMVAEPESFMPRYHMHKHFFRKHGPGKYYGQNGKS